VGGAALAVLAAGADGRCLISVVLEWKNWVLDYDELARTKSAGVCPVQRRKALVKALGSENPKRKATSSIPRFSFVK
jgi:hypothetical protein